jgi:hypothetical protein
MDTLEFQRKTPLRYVHFNDDNETFICIYVFPARYHILRISPFSLLQSEAVGTKTFGACATFRGFQYIALTGLPADPHFDTRCVLVRHHPDPTTSRDILEHTFEQHILTVRVTSEYLICAFCDHAEIWFLQTGASVHTIQFAVNVHAPLGVSPDGKYIACTGSSTLDACLYSLATRESADFRVADNPVSLITFSSSSQYFATGSSAGHTIKIWKCEKHLCVIKFKRGNTSSVIFSVTFSPESHFLAVLTHDGIITFFDMKKAVDRGSAPTIKSFATINIGDGSIAYISWFKPSQIAIINMTGKLMILTVDPSSLREVGREQLSFVQSIAEGSALATPKI